MKIILFISLLAIAGCSNEPMCSPCNAGICCSAKEWKPGFHWWTSSGQTGDSHCIPCEQAHSKEERFVCFGKPGEK